MLSLRLRGIVLSFLLAVVLISVSGLSQSLEYTSTFISCESRQAYVGDEVICAASVQNLTGSSNPTGKVHFNRMGKGTGYFGAGNIAETCELIPFGVGRSDCEMSYTATKASEFLSEDGSHIIIGTFEGSGQHAASSGSDEIKIMMRATVIELDCEHDTILIGEQTNCLVSASARDPERSPFVTGIIAFMSEGLDGDAQCTLLIDTITSTCTISLTATAPAGIGHIHAFYLGNDFYRPTELHFEMEKLRRGSKTEIQCDSLHLKLGEPASCSIRVTDTVGANKTSPHGLIQVGNLENPDIQDFEELQCELVPSGTDSSSCQIAFLPRGLGEHVFQVHFIEEMSIHAPSETALVLVVEGGSFTDRNQTKTELFCQNA